MLQYVLNILLLVCITSIKISANRYFGTRYYHQNPHDRNLEVYKDSKFDSLMRSYESYRGQKYIYPKSTVPRSDYAERNGEYESNSGDQIKFNSDVIDKFDTLQSDYGDFSSNLNKVQKLEYPFYRKSRPKFKTARNYSDESLVPDYTYLANFDKIPRYDLQSKLDKSLSAKINDYLKMYFYKLFKKIQQSGASFEGNKQELLDLSEEIDEDIESMAESSENDLFSQKFYGANNNGYNIFNTTKGKLFDPTKISMIKNSTQFLAKKFLSLFTIIKFPNNACTGSNGVNMYEGTCYYESECQARNGTAMGICADGYGVCCVFVRSCGASSAQNCSYFESPNYPNYYPTNGTIIPPTLPPSTNSTIDPRLRHHLIMFLARQEMTGNSLSCLFQVIKCRLAFDNYESIFLDLELRGPVNGTCSSERFVVTGENRNNLIPDICGYNSGQHMYIDITDVSGPIQFAVLAEAVERKRFRIRICQITECSNPLNCLQYYTGRTGVLSSFNYDQASSLSRSTPGYFNNLNYAICIRKEAGYCSITYTNVANGTSYQFQLRNFDDAGLSTTAPGQAGSEIFGCPDDYVVVNGVRLCGERFNDGTITIDLTRNAPVTDNTGGPFIVPVRTDRSATGRGFRLFYMQNLCTN